MKIRLATKKDVAEILKITEEHALVQKSSEERIVEGFLISGYSEKFYDKYLHSITIAEHKGRVIGFVLAYPRSSVPPEVDDIEFVDHATGTKDYVLFKQVAVRKANQGQGVGSVLYESILASGVAIAAAQVVLEPLNLRSVRFHERLGFRLSSEYVHPNDEMVKGVFVKNNQFI